MTKRGGRKPARAISAKAVTFTPALVSWDFLPIGAKFNYAREVGDGLNSSVIVPPVSWVMRNFTRAPCVVERRGKEGSDLWEVQHGHPAEEMLEQPNGSYTGSVLWKATALDYCFGEAFWLKVRDAEDALAEIWWIPRGLIEPKGQYTDKGIPTLTHYVYRIGGHTLELDPKDVVHFRFGLDPHNQFRGFSPLAAILREVYTDDQASAFTAAILKNMGVIGVVFSPEGSANIPPAKLTEFKNYVQTEFTGDKRGKAIAFSTPTKAEILQYNLQGFDVGPIRDISEERVCAALGIPAAVVGFGTGLQTTKVGATMREMIQQAWRDCLMPLQEDLAKALKESFLSEFQENTNLFRVRFDVSRIRALWEDEKDKALRVATLVEKSLLTVGEGRRELGYTADEKHDFYLRQVTMQAVPADDPMRQVARVSETTPPGTEPPPTEPVPEPPPQEPGGAADGTD